jgi:hypothetical protein
VANDAGVTKRAREIDTDSDRYPTLGKVLHKIGQEIGKDTSTVERVEVNVLPSGEATYRYWAPRAEESEGGYLAPEALL